MQQQHVERQIALAVDRVTQAAGDLQRVRQLVVDFAERGVGAQVIVGAAVVVVEARAVRLSAEIQRVGQASAGAEGAQRDGFGRNVQAVAEHVVVRLGGVVDEVAADAEIQLALVVRLQAELFGSLTEHVLLDVEDPQGAGRPDLRVSHDTADDRRADDRRGQERRQVEGRIKRRRRADAVVVVLAVEGAGRIARLRRQGQIVVQVPLDVEFIRVAAVAVDRLDRAGFGPQVVAGLHVRIQIARREADGAAVEACEGLRRVGRAISVRTVERAVGAALAELVLGDRVGRERTDRRQARIVDAELLAHAVTIVDFAEVFPHQVGAEIVVRLPAGGQAGRVEIPVVLLGVQEVVGDRPVALLVVARRADGEGVAEGNVHEAVQLRRIVVADVGRQTGFVAVLRLVREHVDRAAGGVTAVQRALRAAQDFDALNVKEVRRAEVVRDQRNVVLVNADTGVGARGARALGADAADLEVVPAEVRVCEVDVRDGLQKVFAASDLLGLQGVRRKGRDGDRHVLNGFFAALSRHDQGLDDAGFIRARRGAGGEAVRGEPESRRRNAKRKHAAQTQCICHIISPAPGRPTYGALRGVLFLERRVQRGHPHDVRPQHA